MALLEDPTIQRILDEVNKAATGGVFGLAGNYIPDSPDVGKRAPPAKHQAFHHHHHHHQQSQQHPPMFYPTANMFGLDDRRDFHPNMDMKSIEPIVPVAAPNNFDLYSAGLYNTMPQNMLSPYENYKTDNHKHRHVARPISTVSSTNNDILLEHHRHLEYPTIPPKITAAVPNLGLNLRVPTPQVDTIQMQLADTDDGEFLSEPMPNVPTDTATASIDLVADKDDSSSLPMNENEEVDGTNLSSAGRIFYDPNPQIIQRKGSNSVTYKQNIIVRFLQPPTIPNAGPLVIKEISSQQQPPLPPLVIKQRPTPPKTPPPLFIRERPPPLPSTVATKVITRHVPPDPAPPRAVIIERLPPLPPKPRDIVIERWLPYEIVNQKRKVIVERAQKTSKDHPQSKNVIITYEPVHAKIERHFQKHNIIREDPQAYISRFGEQLYESSAVVQQARAAGVLEDLNPPASYLKSSTTTTNNVSTGTTDYDLLSRASEEHRQEHGELENHEKRQDDEITRPSSISPVDRVQEDDVFIEENITPFYMNSGENLQETLHRLGIDIPKHIGHNHEF